MIALRKYAPQLSLEISNAANATADLKTFMLMDVRGRGFHFSFICTYYVVSNEAIRSWTFEA